MRTWNPARQSSEAEVWEALERLDPLWDELFPAEQARIVQLLVEPSCMAPASKNRGWRNGAPKVSEDERTLTVRVPVSVHRRGGRKLVLAPDGTMG